MNFRIAEANLIFPILIKRWPCPPAIHRQLVLVTRADDDATPRFADIVEQPCVSVKAAALKAHMGCLVGALGRSADEAGIASYQLDHVVGLTTSLRRARVQT